MSCLKRLQQDVLRRYPKGPIMHSLAVEAIIRSVQKRVAQGDFPTEPAQSIETLEEVIVELANARLRRQIMNDPDDDPSVP